MKMLLSSCLLFLALASTFAEKAPLYQASGLASWYGEEFQGRLTANGERFDKEAMTAAHRSLPFGTYLRVINLDTMAECVVRVNDRGPFVDDRILDVSEAAARALGMIQSGTARVGIQEVPAPPQAPSIARQPASSIPTSAAPGAASGAASQPVRIQIASYRDAKNARATVERLGLAGIEASIEEKDGYYRVIIILADRSRLEEFTRRLRELGYRDFMVQLPRAK